MSRFSSFLAAGLAVATLTLGCGDDLWHGHADPGPLADAGVMSPPPVTSGSGTDSDAAVAMTQSPIPEDAGRADVPSSSDAAAEVIAAPASAAAACARRSERAFVTNVEETRAFLTRRWVLCSAKGLLRRPQAGLEIRADGRFSLLEWTADGGLRPKTGLENEGAVSFSASGPIEFSGDRGFEAILHPTWGQDPRAVSFDNEGVDRYDYVAADELSPAPAVESAVPSAGPFVGAAACGQAPGERVAVVTVAAARAALAGKCLLCSDVGLAQQPQVGLEITSDDHFYLLESAPDGSLVRQRGLHATGPVSYLPVGAETGDPPHVQVGFDVGGGTVISVLSQRRTEVPHHRQQRRRDVSIRRR